MGILNIKWKQTGDEEKSVMDALFDSIIIKAEKFEDGFDQDVAVHTGNAFEKEAVRRGIVVCQINVEPLDGFITYGVYPNTEAMEKREAYR
jgi:hypothetical protein